LAQTKRIMISVPNKLLQEVDQVVQEGNGNRSQFIREAVQMYILHRKRATIREQLKYGYQNMADINLLLAEEDSDDDQLLDHYERLLAEAE